MVCLTKSMKKIDLACHIICIVAVIVYAIMNIYSYWKNEDLCEVSFKTFHDEKGDIYPSLTMCLNTPFKTNELLERSQNVVNASMYESYLLGRYKDVQKFANISYEDVSIQTDDFLVEAYASDKDFSVRDQIQLKEHMTVQSWAWYWGVMKCFTFNVPFKDAKIGSMGIEFKNSIFPNNGQRPTDGWESGGMHLFFHYPNQFSRSFPTNKRFWQIRRSNKNSHRLRFYLKDMEVLRKRQKTDDICLEKDMMQIDDWLTHHIMDQVKCRPPYWNDQTISNSTFPVCDTNEKLQEAVRHFFNFFYGSKEKYTPCTEIMKLGIDYEEPEYDTLKEDTTRISWYYRTNTFKEIRQMRAYTGMMLLGNVGGFFGVLLGYAFVQVPSLLNIIIRSICQTDDIYIKTTKTVDPLV